jgi:hypothetical protein
MAETNSTFEEIPQSDWIFFVTAMKEGHLTKAHIDQYIPSSVWNPIVASGKILHEQQETDKKRRIANARRSQLHRANKKIREDAAASFFQQNPVLFPVSAHQQQLFQLQPAQNPMAFLPQMQLPPQLVLLSRFPTSRTSVAKASSLKKGV